MTKDAGGDKATQTQKNLSGIVLEQSFVQILISNSCVVVVSAGPLK